MSAEENRRASANLAAEEVLKMQEHKGFGLLLDRLFWITDVNIMHLWSDTLTSLHSILSNETPYERTRSRMWLLL